MNKSHLRQTNVLRTIDRLSVDASGCQSLVTMIIQYVLNVDVNVKQPIREKLLVDSM